MRKDAERALSDAEVEHFAELHYQFMCTRYEGLPPEVKKPQPLTKYVQLVAHATVEHARARLGIPAPAK
ncbi:hypothetical protein C2E21_7467 [Chlorella sorokiniana]|uniref:Uncharacterized protein n=1 Tax=Chlorella sorokiniana TaxID=3076 RepID=A0A2P6TI54_CHLSO|nr:hypothetical protein C2E21_7467 [Chlorella sorokiniana]|eukprot:PRW33946.1 hypothetical protein C2E21_7467 [Chlorella sorokiniana]